jgi:hypothetical protein
VKAGDDRCFCQRSNSRRLVGAPQMPLPPSLLPSLHPSHLYSRQAAMGDDKTGSVLSVVEWPHWHAGWRGQRRSKVMERARAVPGARV